MDGTTETDEKLRRVMQQLMQTESEKHVMRYERDLVKEKLEETRQQLVETDRLMKAKHREAEVNRNRLGDLERECEAMRIGLRDRDAIIQKAGLVLYGAESSKPTESTDNKSSDSGVSLLLLSPDVANTLENTAGSTLDEKLRTWLGEAAELRAKIKKYKEDFDRVVQQPTVSRFATRSASNNPESVTGEAVSSNSQSYDALIDLQKETSRQLSDVKMRLLKTQEERNTLEQQSARFEQQAKRYKQQLTELESEGETLKQERRRLQKELREKEAQISELEYTIQDRSRQIEKLQKRSNTNF